MRTKKKVIKELENALERYGRWCKMIDNKEILQRNTPQEIEELDKDIKPKFIGVFSTIYKEVING